MTQATWRVEWLWRSWTFGLVLGPTFYELHVGPLVMTFDPYWRDHMVERWPGLAVEAMPWEYPDPNSVAVEPIGTLGNCHHCTKPITAFVHAYQIQTGERFCNEQCVDDWRVRRATG